LIARQEQAAVHPDFWQFSLEIFDSSSPISLAPIHHNAILIEPVFRSATISASPSSQTRQPTGDFDGLVQEDNPGQNCIQEGARI
jgi:hypothetical protein